MTCLTCIAVGFFLRMVPVISALIGAAFWARLLAPAGALDGMTLSGGLLAGFETGPSGIVPMAAPEKARPPV
jgi:hypothetical protein